MRLVDNRVGLVASAGNELMIRGGIVQNELVNLGVRMERVEDHLVNHDVRMDLVDDRCRRLISEGHELKMTVRDGILEDRMRPLEAIVLFMLVFIIVDKLFL